MDDRISELRDFIESARNSEPIEVDRPSPAERTNEYVMRMQRESKRKAVRNGRAWEPHEFPILRRTDISISQKALALGRTYLAVKRAISRFNGEGLL